MSSDEQAFPGVLELSVDLEHISTYLKNKLIEYLPIDNVCDIDENISLFEQGLTSLKATELQYALAKDLKININSTVLFNYSTLKSLIQYLDDQREREGTGSSSKLLNEHVEAKRILYEKFGI